MLPVPQAQFPRTLDEVGALRGRYDSYKKEHVTWRDSLTQAITRINAAISCIEEIEELFRGLEDSWKFEDPGKSRAAYFFLATDGENTRVVAREFVPATTTIFTKESFDAYLEENRHKGYLGNDFRFSPYIGVPPRFKIVPLSEVATLSCPLCGGHHPAVEKYEQTEDSSDGDTWQMDILVFCPAFNLISIAETKTSEYRFR